MVTVAASACGGPATATGPSTNGTTATTNGLENKSPADVLHAAAAALRTAKSVHIVGAEVDGHFDFRMQRSSTGTSTYRGGRTRIRVIGPYAYQKIDRGHHAGRWLKYPVQQFKELIFAEYFSNPFSGYGPLEPKVQQATVHGQKVVVVSWRNGSKVYVAGTGPAYPLREDFKGNYPVWMVFSEYNVPFDVTAPRNAIDAPKGG
jgi:hypothetical protein